MVPSPVSDTRVAMARLAIIVTVCAWLAYLVNWSNQGVSPAIESTDLSGSAWKALFGVPGEPSGAPAIGADQGTSSAGATPAAAPSAS